MGEPGSLDALARDLARGQISRRTALRRFLGGAAGLALPSALIAEPALARCPPSRKCGSKCCPAGQQCKHGKCKCKGGLTKCGKKCRDVSSDPANCGSCGHACAAGQTCVNGQCTGGATGAVCGDGKAEGAEICDGADLKGATCQSLGFIGGVLRCSANCVYDMSGCTSTSCTTAADCPQGPAGDCQQAVCVSGACGFIADNADTPASSGACMTGACINGVPSQANAPAGVACAGGVCNGQGACVGCNVAGDCPQGSATDCQKAVCVSGTCGFVADDTETPASDGNPCTIETCVNGVPSHTNAPLNTACGTGMFCNAGGQCVGCNSPGQCPPPANVCQIATCNGNVCGFGNAPPGTTCQAATCSNGTRQNASTCDGSGTCVAGGTVSCSPYKCNGNACGTSCNTSNDCASGFGCAGNVCKLPQGAFCMGDSQCATAFCADGVCCESRCGGICEKCNQTGRLGFCDAVPNGADPDNECSGGTGFCNGARACG